LRTPETVADMRRTHAASGCVNRGQVFGVGLAWPPPGVMPPDSAAVAALGVAGSGEVWGATSGRQARLFRMPEPLLVGYLGPIEGTGRVADRLVFDGRGRLYGAGRDAGGQLFSYETGQEVLWIYINFGGGIDMHGPVFEDDGVATLAVSPDGTTLAGIGDRTGRLFLQELAGGARTVVEPPGGNEGGSRVLVAGADNCFYGAGRRGELFRLTRDGALTGLGVRLPGEEGLASLIVTREGGMFGGTGDGRLLRLSGPDCGDVTDCGRPSRTPCLHSLVEADDGRIYGITGTAADLARLVCFRPGPGTWEDLGMLRCHGHAPWTAFRIGPMVAGRHGELIAGENDRFGHLYVYHPEPERSQGRGNE
jgi:hypothetical protein